MLLSVMQPHELETSNVMKKDGVMEGIRVTPLQYSNVSPSDVHPGQWAEVDSVLQVCGYCGGIYKASQEASSWKHHSGCVIEEAN